MGPMSITYNDPPDPNPQNVEAIQPSWLQTSKEEIHSHVKEGVPPCGFIHLILMTMGALENHL
jgi:hypothetical protein